MKNQVFGGILTFLLELAIGILLLINWTMFTAAIAIVAGVVLCLMGIRSVFVYFRTDAETAAKGSNLTLGLAELLLGAFLISNSDVIVAMTPVLTVVYGLVILFGGLAKIQTTVNMLRLKHQRWYFGAIAAIVSLACAGVILLNPFATTDALWIFLGISLIVEAVLDILSTILGRKVREEKASEEKTEVNPEE